ncbi:leucine-rich repeat domain-containing protein [Prosthecobacter dejongeii]|uniref:Leucine-rich repeat (LRR) protein n=1 Tax=Prosthecobacter dejongeii TaxID=48465 RepID=A0A7W7YHY8_9BACT|nr:leucine-rich repeat domain-containing protein [Prosthecobacter dejongeii]MBB5036372.1 Leucine-rich repeat (LRR) protein [Prosthecobacter dejongeii]
MVGHGSRDIGFLLDIPDDAQLSGNTLILNKPEDVPSQVQAFGILCPLPSKVRERDSVWTFEFLKYGGWDTLVVNSIPVAVLGSDVCPPGPLPPGDEPIAVSWCAYRGLEGLVPTSRIKRLQIQALKPLTAMVLKAVSHLSDLKYLELVAKSAQELSAWLFPQSLTGLSVNLPEDVEDLNSFRFLSNLTVLHLVQCKSLRNVEVLGKLLKIENLKLQGATTLTDITEIGDMKSLRVLDLSGAMVLRDLSPLARLQRLHSVNLMHCDMVTDISPLAAHEGLKRLDLSGCGKLRYLGPLNSLIDTEVTLPTGGV